MSHRSIPILAVFGLTILTSLVGRDLRGQDPGRSDHLPQPRLPNLVEEALWWLPADTQTVLVARGPSKFLEAFGCEQGEDGIFVGSWPPSIVHQGKPGPLAGETVKLLVEGSRRYRPPTWLGLMRYEGAMVAVFERDLDAQIARSLHEGATRTETIAGRKVSLFTVPFERDDWTIYVTQPRPNVLISATHRGYLSDLLGRMDQRKESRALPDSLPEWKHLDPTARLWAVRHYDRNDAEFDPTSPSGQWTVRDSQAVGLVFSYDPRKHEAKVRHLSKSRDAGRAFKDFWNLAEKPEDREIGLGIMELSATLKLGPHGPGVGDMFFRFSVALGHGLCL